MSLVAVVEQFQEVSEEQKIKLARVYEDLQEATDDATAMSIIQSIDRGEIETKKDLYDLMESLKEYKTKEVDSFLDINYEYNFEPPGDEFPAEYSDLLHKSRLLTITEEGTWMEIDEENKVIGPVDRDHNPAPGHPEYIEVDLSGITKAEVSTLEIPKSNSELSEDQINVLFSRLVANGSAGDIDQLGIPAPSIKPLEEVFLETEIGNLLFEPEKAIHGGRCFVLVFDTARSKPPLYPRVGSNFRLKYKQYDLAVSYMDTTFTYNDRKFIIFIILF